MSHPSTSTIRVIEPPSRWLGFGLAELWRYRDLLLLLIWRDISSRYRQSVIGLGWAVITPLVSVGVFTLIFGNVAKLPTGDVPYPLFNLAGLVPWLYFAGGVTGAATSVVAGRALVSKAAFPRLILPVAKLCVGLVDVGIQLVLLAGLMACYGVQPSWRLLAVPAVLAACLVTALSVGVWLAALNVRFRDIHHAVPFLVQMWMWLTPVVYSTGMVPEGMRLIYALNPMVGVVDGFRWTVLGSQPPDTSTTALTLVVVIALLLGGLAFFRRTEETFADVI